MEMEMGMLLDLRSVKITEYVLYGCYSGAAMTSDIQLLRIIILSGSHRGSRGYPCLVNPSRRIQFHAPQFQHGGVRGNYCTATPRPHRRPRLRHLRSRPCPRLQLQPPPAPRRHLPPQSCF